jgi:hypothetical protein
LLLAVDAAVAEGDGGRLVPDNNASAAELLICMCVVFVWCYCSKIAGYIFLRQIR